MTYGTLTAIMGPMFAGKTSELMKGILWVRHQSIPFFVIKPAIDDRYSTNQEIITHTGLRIPCHYLHQYAVVDTGFSSGDAELLSQIQKSHGSVVFIDEIQFFDLAIIRLIKEWLCDGHNITVCGLDMDTNGDPFNISAQILAMSDHVMKLKSICAVTGAPASKTQKLQLTGNKIDVGGANMYEPRSNNEWVPVK